jgi:hypothetical protein
MKRFALLLSILFVCSVASGQAPAGFIKLGNVSATTYTDTGCPDLTTCYYIVKAVDSFGFESVAAPCATTALCLGGNQAVAQMPSSGAHSVVLSWTASTTAGVTYNVYVHVGPFAPSSINATVN